MLPKTTECLLLVHKKGGFSLFRLLFGVILGSFQPILACYDLFHVVALFTSDNVIEYLDLQIYYQSTSCRFYCKVGQTLIQGGTALIY